MKTRMYMLAKNVSHPMAKDQTTRVYYTGWGHNNPSMGTAWSDGCRTAILFPTQTLVQIALDEMPKDFTSDIYVVDAQIERV